MAVFWVVAVFIIRAMMEAASTSETSVNFYQTTRRIITEDSHLHNRRRENLRSHLKKQSVNLRFRKTTPDFLIWESLSLVTCSLFDFQNFQTRQT
jgi:hypothetical protein